MKKAIYALIAAMILIFSSCAGLDDASYQPKEQPHLYWKDIDVVVTDIDRQHWFATTHWYEVSLTVKSDEYGLVQSFTIKESGALNCPTQWEYREGDVVRAELYSWSMDSTGEVIRREIHKVY